jgi:hypothetical protein
MRRILTAAAMALAILAAPAAAHAKPPAPVAPKSQNSVAIASIPPVFNNYLVCVGGFVYTDFTDPDGNDTLLSVEVWMYGPSVGWIPAWLNNTGNTVHGVFFWLEPAAVGINMANITQMWFHAVDQTGTWSTSWTVSNQNCVLQ